MGERVGDSWGPQIAPFCIGMAFPVFATNRGHSNSRTPEAATRREFAERVAGSWPMCCVRTGGTERTDLMKAPVMTGIG
ncbi:hypothetical protein PG997_014036 [Apiospora hydei]|uniref:Uncharacterized protein n=1 Tax=Apiospora hydei TaxID=1337664 RepID=A0ABR1V7W9_9PEZI